MKLSELNPQDVEFSPSSLRLSDLHPDEVEFAEAAPKVSEIESGLRGAAQGASLGFADEALGALSNAANKWVNPNASLFDTQNYERVRNEQRAADAAAKQANPKTYLAGELGGGMALPVGSLNAGKAALLGGAQAFGSSNSEDASSLARDAGTGAVLGGAVGAVAPYVSQGLNKIGGMVSDAVEGAGNVFKTGADAFANRATNSDFGREALDSGAIKFGDNAAKIADRLGDLAPSGLKERAAQEAKGFFSDSDKMGIATSLVGGPHAAASVTSGIVGKNLANTRGAASGAVALDKIGDILQQTPQMFGKFTAPLQAAQQRGALNPTVYILQQTNPEFREMLFGNEDK